MVRHRFVTCQHAYAVYTGTAPVSRKAVTLADSDHNARSIDGWSVREPWATETTLHLASARAQTRCPQFEQNRAPAFSGAPHWVQKRAPVRAGPAVVRFVAGCAARFGFARGGAAAPGPLAAARGAGADTAGASAAGNGVWHSRHSVCIPTLSAPQLGQTTCLLCVTIA